MAGTSRWVQGERPSDNRFKRRSPADGSMLTACINFPAHLSSHRWAWAWEWVWVATEVSGLVAVLGWSDVSMASFAASLQH